MFGIGAINIRAQNGMMGEIGRLLVCGNRETPMSDEEIHLVHSYLV